MEHITIFKHTYLQRVDSDGQRNSLQHSSEDLDHL